MGLEIAEFVIALEDELGFSLDDASPFDAETQVIVAMIVDYVERKIREKETAELMAEDYPFKVFAQTAAILAQFAEVPVNDIAPETLLTDLFPDPTRWREMRQKNDGDNDEMDVALNQLVDFERIYKKSQRTLNLGAILCHASCFIRIVPPGLYTHHHAGGGNCLCFVIRLCRMALLPKSVLQIATYPTAKHHCRSICRGDHRTPAQVSCPGRFADDTLGD